MYPSRMPDYRVWPHLFLNSGLRFSMKAIMPSRRSSIEKVCATDSISYFRPVLKSAFEKMELVTREEFDAQAGVLERLKARLETLERQLNELEPG